MGAWQLSTITRALLVFKRFPLLELLQSLIVILTNKVQWMSTSWLTNFRSRINTMKLSILKWSNSLDFYTTQTHNEWSRDWSIEYKWLYRFKALQCLPNNLKPCKPKLDWSCCSIKCIWYSRFDWIMVIWSWSGRAGLTS